MQISSQQPLSVSQQRAWDALNNVEVLQHAIPGCESLVEQSPQHYEVHITAAVGPVKAKFKGKLRLSDLQPPTSYKIDFEGQGGAAGHGKGSAAVRLEFISPNACVLHYEAHATVGGKIAQIGQRLVDMAAQKMAGEFFQNFNAQLQALHPTAAQDAGLEPPVEESAGKRGSWAMFKAWLKRLFKPSRSASTKV